MSSRPTIRDVAQLSGFSITTVSLVLNRKGANIPQRTKDKIWNAASTLNYRPNQLAVSMVTKKSGVLGLIVPDNSNLFFASLSKAIEETAHKAGYALIYGNSNNNPQRDYDYLHMFIDRRVDGIIYTRSASSGESEIEKIISYSKEITVPLVTLDRQLPAPNVRAVKLNDYKGGYLATKHLLDLGHTRIGCLTGPSDLSSSQARLEGHLAALEEAGLHYNPDFIFEGDYQTGLEHKALEHFLKQNISAVFSFNDIMAIGIYRAAQQKGLSIPADLSVVGFDNLPIVDMLMPPLTTISQPVNEMGACAVEILVNLIDGQPTKNDRKSYVFEPRFVLRDSTAPYPSKEDHS